MRNTSGDNGPVLPWLLIRQDGHGNRYRVGSYATRAEAQSLADRLADRLASGAAATAGAADDGYLVESRDQGSGARG